MPYYELSNSRTRLSVETRSGIIISGKYAGQRLGDLVNAMKRQGQFAMFKQEHRESKKGRYVRAMPRVS
jgi:hypothetical protein